MVFHSLRHSSTTYKLKLNHGDLKATQGDTGHAQIDMITSVYAHILDEDRKVNAQKFEDAFYASANPDLRTVRPPAKTRGPKEPESGQYERKLRAERRGHPLPHQEQPNQLLQRHRSAHQRRLLRIQD